MAVAASEVLAASVPVTDESGSISVSPSAAIPPPAGPQATTEVTATATPAMAAAVWIFAASVLRPIDVAVFFMAASRVGIADPLSNSRASRNRQPVRHLAG
jgi:hypothetical protein